MYTHMNRRGQTGIQNNENTFWPWYGCVELPHTAVIATMRAFTSSLVALTTCCLSSVVLGAISPRSVALLHSMNGEVSNVSEDLISRCEKHWFTTKLDHFSRVRARLLCVRP